MPRPASMPVSHTQQRLWFLRQIDPGSSTYNVDRRHPPGRPARRAGARARVRRRRAAAREPAHAVLRARRRAALLQSSPKAGRRCEFVDLSAGRSRGQRDEQARAGRARARRAKPFDLRARPLLRAGACAPERAAPVLLGRRPHRRRRHLGGHPVRRVAGAVPAAHRRRGRRNCRRCPCSTSTTCTGSAKSWPAARWTNTWRTGRTSCAVCRRCLSLPTDRPRPRMQTHRGARRVELLPLSLGRRAESGRAPRRRDAVHADAGRRSRSCCTATAARTTSPSAPSSARATGRRSSRWSASSPTTSCCGPTCRATRRCASCWRRVRETALRAYAHQEMPFDLLVEALAPRRDLDHSPLFQVLFVLHSDPHAAQRHGQRHR